MALRDQLENAGPGAVVRFSGKQTGIGKVINLRGTQAKPIVIEAADPSAVIGSSGARDVANLRLEGCSWVTLRGFALRDATMDQARTFQAFGCDNLLFEDILTGPNVRWDHFHFVNSHDCTGRRCKGDGAGMQALVDDKGGHWLYVAEGCHGIVWEDGEYTGGMAAPLQANAQSGPVSDVTFRRIRLRGWANGAAVNIPGAQKITIEDLTADGPGGVRAYAGASGIVLRRYSISADPPFEGPVQAFAGAPALPRFDTAPPPPQEAPAPPAPSAPPTPDLAAELAQVRAERDRLLAKVEAARRALA